MPDVLSLTIKTIAVPAGLFAILGITLPEHLPLIAFSGLCGGVCRWIADKTRFWPSGCGTMVGGALVAIFLWPLANAILGDSFSRMEMDPVTSVMIGGFIAGLLGMNLIGLILDIFKARRLEVTGDGRDGDKG